MKFLLSETKFKNFTCVCFLRIKKIIQFLTWMEKKETTQHTTPRRNSFEQASGTIYFLLHTFEQRESYVIIFNISGLRYDCSLF